MRVKLAVATFSLFLFACGAIEYGQLSPRPNVAINGHENDTIAVAWGKGFRDNTSVYEGNGCRELALKQVSKSVYNGFNAAFGDAFKVVGSNATYTLTFVEVTPSLTPSAVSGNGAVAACGVTIRYKVLLDGPDGRKAATGQAFSKNAAGAGPGDVASAMETMFEQIAEKFFAK